MKNKIIYLFLFLVVAATSGYYAWMENVHDHAKNGPSNHDQMAEKKIVYACPMHPHITSDKPGQKCSICGMDLVPMDNNEKDTGGETDNSLAPKDHVNTRISLNRQQMIGVKTEKAKKRKLFKVIKAPGRIAFDPELYTAQSEYLESLKQWNRVKNSPLQDVKRNTQEMIRSSKIKLRVLGLSDSQISNLGKSGRQSEGLLVSGKGQQNWIYADVFEMDLPSVEKGLSAEITANFLQGKKLVAKVISVDQVINSETRTAKVRLQLIDTNESIRPESYVNVKIHTPVGEHISVPVEAIMDTGIETYIFVKKQEGIFEPRKVSILLETDEYIALRAGVKEGEEIVVGGNFMMDSESRLKSVISNSGSNSGHSH